MFDVNPHWDGLAILGVNPRTLRVGQRTRERMAQASGMQRRYERCEDGRS
jgi:hypothetical protein